MQPSDLHFPEIFALDFSFWKRASVRQCFFSSRVNFVTDVSTVPAGAGLVVWGMRSIQHEMAVGIKVFRLEDGFLRSVGLGADLVKPVSWVLDSQGIYYDATRRSDLELLLGAVEFDPELVKRAEVLRKRIVEEEITKYNVDNSLWQRPIVSNRVILVAGQAESDDSLKYGAPKIRSNIELLQTVRLANPRAYIVYKPHPDVVARLRASGVNEDAAKNWCDEIVTNVSMGDLLPKVDDVAVLTSLTGFEALLRGKSVTCYGQPFYAGWGLTKDIVPLPRRQRRLSLDQLVAGTLILYPVYFSRTRKVLITPEEALDELVAWRAKEGGVTPWWRKVHRTLLRRIVGVR